MLPATFMVNGSCFSETHDERNTKLCRWSDTKVAKKSRTSFHFKLQLSSTWDPILILLQTLLIAIKSLTTKVWKKLFEIMPRKGGRAGVKTYPT